MAVRRRVVRPEPGEMQVSREQMAASMMDAESMLSFAGGVLTVIVDRQPTGVPGEMVTVAALFEWKDRTDAKPQPERADAVIPAGQQDPDPDPEPEELERQLEAEAASGEPDGLDLSQLEEEDLSSIPASMR